MKKYPNTIILALILLLNSCNPVATTQMPSKVPTSSIEPSLTPAPKLTSTPYPTNTLTLTPLPTATLVPSITPTPHPLSISPQNASKLKLVAKIGVGKVNDVAWAKQKPVIGVAQDSAIYLYHSETFDVLGKMNFGASKITFSPDSNSFAVVNDANIVIWNIDGKRIIHQFNSRIAGIRQVIFSPGGTYLAALGVAYLGGGDPDHVIEAWEVNSGKKLLIQQGFGWEGEIAFSPDGRTLALGSPFGVTLFNVLTGKILQTNTDIEIGLFIYLPKFRPK